MSDEQHRDEQQANEGEPSTGEAGASAGDAKGGAAAEGSAGAEAAPLAPGEAFAKGLGLLFQAALGTASAVKDSVERGGVHRNISDAGRRIETAASAALRGLEQIVRNVGRSASTARPNEQPGGAPDEPGEPKADPPAPEDPPDRSS